MHLSWTKPIDTDVTNYKVYSGTSADSLSLLETLDSASSYDATGLTNGTTYYFAVEAVDAAGHPSGRTSAGLRRCPTDTVAPARRPRDSWRLPGDGSVTLTWDAVPAGDLETYRVQYSSAPDVWTTITNVSPGSETG